MKTVVQRHRVDSSLGRLPYGITILPSGDVTTYRRMERVQTRTQENRQRRGLNGISSYARKQIRSACTLLEQRHGKSKLAFFTGTLPALTPQMMYQVCVNWSEVVRQFMQSIRRLLERAGLDAEIVHVTEIQEKRYAATGLPVPHIHAVWHGRTHRYARWALSIKQIESVWKKVIHNILLKEFSDTEVESISFLSATNIQAVKKSAANYLSKYCSKGTKLIKRIAKSVDPRLIPKAWYGMSQTIKTEIAEKTIKGATCVGFSAFRELLKRFGISYSYAVKTCDGESEIAISSVIPPHLIDRFMIAYLELHERFGNTQHSTT
jgi:hypothetical protein